MKLLVSAAAAAVVAGGMGFYAYKQLVKSQPENAKPVSQLEKPTEQPAEEKQAGEKPAAGPGTPVKKSESFLGKVQESGKATVCDYDFSKVQLPTVQLPTELPTAGIQSTLQNLTQQTKVKLYVKGAKLRTEASILGLGIVTIVDSATGMSYFYNVAASPAAKQFGTLNAYPNCDWFNFNLNELTALAGTGPLQGQVVDVNQIQTAPGTAFSCREGNFGEEMFAVAKVCGGKQLACDEARRAATILTNPEIAKVCGG